eukprot:scaffold434_cov186-Pinguiococcus_pyrenoidosus.AAC.40
MFAGSCHAFPVPCYVERGAVSVERLRIIACDARLRHKDVILPSTSIDAHRPRPVALVANGGRQSFIVHPEPIGLLIPIGGLRGEVAVEALLVSEALAQFDRRRVVVRRTPPLDQALQDLVGHWLRQRARSVLIKLPAELAKEQRVRPGELALKKTRGRRGH